MRVHFVWIVLALTSAAHAQDDDAAALALPSAPPAASSVARPVTLAVEGAATAASQRAGGVQDEQRLSIDFRFDDAWGSQWRGIVSDRLDLDWFGSFAADQQINTLKEAYLSWQPGTNLLVDAGRINARQGVAFGYNPTDFLRADALRTIDSLDPNSLRDERLGTVMLRGQTFWNSGAFTALVAPRLTGSPNPAVPTAGPFAADWAATNDRNRWLASLSEKVAALTPQVLVFGAEGEPPQLGLNLTTVLGISTVAYVEASAGRSPSLLSQAATAAGSTIAAATALRERASAGLTYSTPFKLSLTVEFEYDGAALSRNAWSSLRQGDPATYGEYRAYVAAQQELPTRDSAFVYASWQDLWLRHLDLGAFVRVDLIDHSFLPWTELRYHWSHVDAALRWQNELGGVTSDFGASPARQTWQLLLDYFL